MTTNDPAAKTVKLKVSARIEMELNVSPARIVFKEFISKNGSSEPHYARLTGSKSASAKIVSVESRNPLLKIDLNKDGFDGDPDSQIRISVLPGMPVGRFREKIIFKTDIESTPSLQLYVMGEAVGNITIKPKNLSLGKINTAKPLKKTIRLRAADDAFTFNIKEISSTIEGLSTELVTITSGKEYQVVASLPEGTTQPVLRGTINIKTDSDEQETINVRVFGFTQAPPGLERSRVKKNSRNGSNQKELPPI